MLILNEIKILIDKMDEKMQNVILGKYILYVIEYEILCMFCIDKFFVFKNIFKIKLINLIVGLWKFFF